MQIAYHFNEVIYQYIFDYKDPGFGIPISESKLVIIKKNITLNL